MCSLILKESMLRFVLKILSSILATFDFLKKTFVKENLCETYRLLEKILV